MIDRLTELGKAFFIFGHSGVVDAAFVEVFGVVENLETVFFDLFDGETLETTREEYEIPRMYACEDKAFIESFKSGIKNRAHIDNVLESAKILDALYESDAKKQEISF